MPSRSFKCRNPRTLISKPKQGTQEPDSGLTATSIWEFFGMCFSLPPVTSSLPCCSAAAAVPGLTPTSAPRRKPNPARTLFPKQVQPKTTLNLARTHTTSLFGLPTSAKKSCQTQIRATHISRTKKKPEPAAQTQVPRQRGAKPRKYTN